jgi:hypothetical protein
MTAPQIPADYEAWRQGRWEEIAGANGKAKVAANAKITDPGPHTLPGIPGEWRTTEAGDLTVTANAADGVQVAGSLVDGTSPVPSGSSLEFPDNRVGLPAARMAPTAWSSWTKAASSTPDSPASTPSPTAPPGSSKASTGQRPKGAGSRLGD